MTAKMRTLMFVTTTWADLTPGVGRTDGESPERGWAAMNPVASSTKEMGPGSRRDTLDDHFGDYNWRKVTSLRTEHAQKKSSLLMGYLDVTLLTKVQEAVAMRAEHVRNFLDLSASLPQASVISFTKIIHQWEASKSKENPYEATVEGNVL